MKYKERINKVSNFYKKNKRMPSYSELMKLAGLKTKSASYHIAKKLISDGYATKDRQGKLLPGRLLFSIPILGTVEAGFPSPAEEEIADTMTLDEYLIENKEATFMLRVSGDSMKDAGIMEGDIVLVERGRTPKDGDIVIAEIDSEWTIKYLKKRGRSITLVAANKKYKPITPKEELNIAAVVRSVVRKY